MTKRSTKNALISSVLVIVLCFTALLGTTFAWFTDSVTNDNNVIQTGTLKIEMSWAEGKEDPNAVSYTDASTGAIFNSTVWEPGYIAARHIKIENKGTLDLKFKLLIAPNGEYDEKLAEVIDVYYLPVATQVTREAIATATPVATLAELIADYSDGAAYGVLEADDATTEAVEGITTVTIALKLRENVGNDYQGISVGSTFALKLLATQNTAEEDSFNNGYDAEATYPEVGAAVITETTTTETTFNAGNASITIPAGMEAGKYEFTVSNKETVVENDVTTVSFDLNLTKNGEKVADDGTEYTIVMEIPKDNHLIRVVHNGEEVSNATYENKGDVVEVTFTVTSFNPFAIEYSDTNPAETFVEALEKGEDASLNCNIKIDPAAMSNAYGKTGINVKEGQTIDGNGYILDIKGAGGTWDSGINTTGGLIKNITVTGSFRGIFINHNSTHSERVILENVIIDGTVYTISCDQGTNQGLTATKSTFKGWTSYAATLGEAKFVDCYFGEGSGYAYMRPYAPTEFVGCDFEEGFEMDPRAAVTFENCTIAGVPLTAENLSTLVTSNIANASVK